eukprot:TRINITY_DN407_c0_g1_i1.p1 TRINITY_DN407_c0_g1~~TRINITY_DN407_c0_g1_i1.p1  ORF type:complete len:212 (-),score=52.54 TRINITY_DN407_c0_g1_i1:27-662(-)
MVFSDLFSELFIDQVQVVGYYHEWNNTDERGGKFVYWDEYTTQPKDISPYSLAGSAVDGSKTIHAATVYRVDQDPPILDKSKDNHLQYQGDDVWHLYEEDKLLKEYSTDDLRMTIVYRARCFKDEAERDHFKNLPEEEIMKLGDIIDIFKADLVKRGKLREGQHMEPLDFAILLLDEYINYPLSPDAIIPFNYCALNRLIPWTNIVLQYFC